MNRFWMTVALVASLAATSVAQASEARVALNEASAGELASIAGVGETLAEDIVALRSQRGGQLDSVEQLRVLPSMTPAALSSLRQGTTVQFELPMGTKRTFATASEVLDEFAGEPDVTAVQGMASDYARVNPGTVRKWLSASRGFAALPQVRFEYRIRDDFSNDFRYFTDAGVPPTAPGDDASGVLTDADVGQDRTMLVRATWDLDQLVMSSEQIRVINEAQDVVKLREKVLGEVTRLYFERRRLQVDMLLQPKSDLMGQVRDELRLRELTASLDAYTGGQFSAAVSGR